jgi:hypothetical protein
MDWQDELRKLDKQLSEGDISAQQYRRLRDELLAEASAPAPGRGAAARPGRPDATPPAPAPDADDTQIVEDATVTVDDEVVNAAKAGKSPDPDKTDTVSAGTVDEKTVTVDDRDTRVVEEPITTRAVGQPIARAFRKPGNKPLPGPTPMAKPSAQAPAETPAEPTARPLAKPPAKPRTQSPAKPPAKPPTKPTRPRPLARSDELAHAPAVEEIAWPKTEEPGSKKKGPTFPLKPSDTPAPLAPPLPKPAAYTGHQVLGEEIFAEAGPHSNARRAATMLLSVVAVLAVIGGGVWYFVFRTEDAPAAQQNTPPAGQAQSEAPPPASKQPPSAKPGNVPPNLADAIGPLPGATDENSGTISAARAGQLKLVSREEVAAAEDIGVTDVIFRGSTKGNIGNALLVFTTPDANSAADLTKAERNLLRGAGFVNGKELRNGLPVLVRTIDGGTVYRVVYSTGKYTVRFGVAQLDANQDELRAELESVADTILAVLPSSG